MRTLPLFGRPAPSPDELASYVPRPNRLRVLRADGQRIDLTSRTAGPALAATRQGWARDAWSYRDQIGELRYAVQLLARNVARVRFYVAEARPHPQDPAPLADPDTEHDLDPQLIADAVHNFGRIPFDSDPDGYTARMVENLSVPGEAWVHIDTDDVWNVRSTSEVTVSPDGRVMINGTPGGGPATQRTVNGQAEDLLRMWRPHPEYGQLADSPMRACLEICEDVVLAGREGRAASRSRIAANGLLLLPSALSLVQARDDDDYADDSVTSDTFMGDFTAAMLAPIRNDGDAQVVVPIVLRGDREDLDGVKHLTMQRPDADHLMARQEAALLRLLKSIDVQPEQVQGVSGLSHWSAWIINSQSINDQIRPMAETLASCHMQAFLRPALESLGHDPDQVRRLVIACDVSALAENPNRGQDARDAHDREVISDEALREALGFDVADAPEGPELVRRSLTKGRLTPQVIPIVVEALDGRMPTAADIAAITRSLPGQPVVNAPPVLPSQAQPVATPGQVTPNQGVPETPNPTGGPITAAAPSPDESDGWQVNVDASRRLGDIDAALLDRITVAADAAVARVVEKAGARVRSAAQKDRAVTASLVGVEPHLIAAHLGRQQVETFAPVADLIVDTYLRLQGQVARWLTAAATQTVDVVLDVLGLDRRTHRAQQIRDTVTVRFAGSRARAATVLTEVLHTAAERALFTPDPSSIDLQGEGSDTLVHPSEIARVLTAAGGGRDDAPAHGGLGTGPTITAALADEGAVLLGWEWQYRPEIPRTPFPPHQQLDGLRFATFTDPKLDTGPRTAWIGPYFYPQDHGGGCRCRAIPILAVPDDPDGIVARRLREAAGDPRNIAAGQVARADDAANRVGTSLQNDTEVRDRIVAGVNRLRREYIEGDTA